MERMLEQAFLDRLWRHGFSLGPEVSFPPGVNIRAVPRSCKKSIGPAEIALGRAVVCLVWRDNLNQFSRQPKPPEDLQLKDRLHSLRLERRRSDGG
jgi:hypothetical protein